MSIDVSKPDDLPNRGLAEARDTPNAPRGLSVKCPDCNSKRVWRNGFRKLPSGEKVQTYICAKCYRKFTEPLNGSRRNLNRQATSSHNFSGSMGVKDLNSSNSYPTSEDEALGKAGSRVDTGGGLVLEKPLQKSERPAGGTEKSVENLLLSFGLWLRKQGRREKTVEYYLSILRKIAGNSNLADSESVKEFLMKVDLQEKSKNTYIAVYSTFLKFVGGRWEKPNYKPVEKMPFIPTEEELDALIAGAGKRMAALLQFLKETGARIGEALKLKWTDVDFERRVVSITPEKGSRPRILPISEKLINMLSILPRRGERVFPTYKVAAVSFRLKRKILAEKLSNPRLLKITFHTFRHWKATMEYHKTKDIIHVKELLGHKDIENTMIYVNVEKALFQYKNDEFYAKTASTVEEALKLIEAGFEYVCDMNGIKLFRKRK